MTEPGSDLPASGVTFLWTRSIRDHGGDLQPRARLAAMLLATWADPDGTNCFPSLETLAAAMGQSRDTARRAIVELEEAGWLLRWFRPHRSTVYRFLIPDVALAEMTEEVVEEFGEGTPVHEPVQGGCGGARVGCTCAPLDALVPPDLSRYLPTDLPRPPRAARRRALRNRGKGPQPPGAFEPSDTLKPW